MLKCHHCLSSAQHVLRTPPVCLQLHSASALKCPNRDSWSCSGSCFLPSSASQLTAATSFTWLRSLRRETPWAFDLPSLQSISEQCDSFSRRIQTPLLPTCTVCVLGATVAFPLTYGGASSCAYRFVPSAPFRPSPIPRRAARMTLIKYTSENITPSQRTRLPPHCPPCRPERPGPLPPGTGRSFRPEPNSRYLRCPSGALSTLSLKE